MGVVTGAARSAREGADVCSGRVSAVEIMVSQEEGESSNRWPIWGTRERCMESRCKTYEVEDKSRGDSQTHVTRF